MAEKLVPVPEHIEALQIRAAKVNALLGKAQSLVNNPGGPDWPERFQVEKIPDEIFLNQSIKLGGVARMIRSNGIPSLEKREATLAHEIHKIFVAKAEEDIKIIAGHVQEGNLPPEALPRAQKALDGLKAKLRPVSQLPPEQTLASQPIVEERTTAVDNGAKQVLYTEDKNNLTFYVGDKITVVPKKEFYVMEDICKAAGYKDEKGITYVQNAVSVIMQFNQDIQPDHRGTGNQNRRLYFRKETFKQLVIGIIQRINSKHARRQQPTNPTEEYTPIEAVVHLPNDKIAIVKSNKTRTLLMSIIDAGEKGISSGELAKPDIARGMDTKHAIFLVCNTVYVLKRILANSESTIVNIQAPAFRKLAVYVYRRVEPTVESHTADGLDETTKDNPSQRALSLPFKPLDFKPTPQSSVTIARNRTIFVASEPYSPMPPYILRPAQTIREGSLTHADAHALDIPNFTGQYQKNFWDLLYKRMLEGEIATYEEMEAFYEGEKKKYQNGNVRQQISYMRKHLRSSIWEIYTVREQGYGLRKKEETQTTDPLLATGTKDADVKPEEGTRKDSKPLTNGNDNQTKETQPQKVVIWKPPQNNEAKNPEEEELGVNLTAIVLERLAFKKMAELNPDLNELLEQACSDKTMLKEMMGDVAAEVFFADLFTSTVERLWGKKREEASPMPERKMLLYCRILGSEDPNERVSNAKRQNSIDAVLKHFGIVTRKAEQHIA